MEKIQEQKVLTFGGLGSKVDTNFNDIICA